MVNVAPSLINHLSIHQVYPFMGFVTTTMGPRYFMVDINIEDAYYSVPSHISFGYRNYLDGVTMMSIAAFKSKLSSINQP